MERKPDLIDYESNISKKEIINWLNELLPYTTNLISRIEEQGVDGVSMWLPYGYALHLREISENNKEIVLKRERLLLKLLSENKDIANKELKNINQDIIYAHKQMNTISYDVQNINKVKDELPKDTKKRMDIYNFRRMLEGVLGPLVNPIIYLLESNKNFNPKYNEIRSRFLSSKYFFNKINKCSIKNDFSLFYELFDVEIRNSEAHMDYEIDCKNEKIIYNIRTRKNLNQKDISFQEFFELFICLSGICKQIALTYNLFFIGNYLQYDLEYDLNFDQEISILKMYFNKKGFKLDKYSIEKNQLSLFFINCTNKFLPKEAFIELLRFSEVFLDISRKSPYEIKNLKLILDNNIYLDIKTSKLEKLEENQTPDNIIQFLVDCGNNIKIMDD